MLKLAVEIGPDLTAHIGPALAEREILAEIGPAAVDHGVEQGVAVVACGRSVERMIALEFQLRIMRAHALDRFAPDHQEAGAGIADFDEAALLGDGVGIVDLEYIAIGRRRS